MPLSFVAALNSPGTGPAGLTWDGHHLWNADFRAGTVFCLNLANGQVVDRLLCPGVLSGLTWDGHALWQVVMDEGGLRRINPATHDFDEYIVIEGAKSPSGLAWDGRHLWTVLQQRGKLIALDPEQGDVTQTIDVPFAGGGLTYRNGALWLGAPMEMRFDEQTQSFVWDSPDERYALLEISIDDRREMNRYELDFLPLGLTWVGEELWLSNARTGKLLCAHLG